MVNYWSIFAVDTGVPVFNALVWGKSLNSGLQILPQETTRVVR